MRQKAARPSDTSAATLAPGAARATAVDTSPATVESLGRLLSDALALRRVSSISIWDGDASVQWLNEGALGPDEHGLVLQAFEQLAADKSLNFCEITVEDGPYNLFLPVRTPSGTPVGVAMILADGRFVGEGPQERIASPAVRAIMQRLAVLMKPAGMTTTSVPALSLLELVPPADSDEAEVSAADESAAAPPEPASVPATEAAPDPAPSGISAQEVSDLLEFELQPDETLRAVPASAHTALPGAVGADDAIPLLQFVQPPVLGAAPAAKAAPAQQPAPSPKPTPTAKPAAAPAASPAAKLVAAASAAPAPKAAPAAHPARAAEPAPAMKPVPAAKPVSQASRLSAVAARVNAAVERARTVQSPAPQPSATPAPAPEPPEAPTAASAPAPTAAASASAVDPNLILEVLQFGKLRAGGQSRRFQVQARTSHQHSRYLPAAMDALILERLVSWLAANRSGWSTTPTSFTLNLSIATLEDERFVQRVTQGMNANGLSPEVLGFEISEALCTQRRALVERFLTQCEKLGTWVVVDDFSFDSQVLPLLRSKAVRLVKLDQKLTSAALKDKLSQALVIATIQAVKVLGIHCAAKQIESQASLQWLTAVGCDFALGDALGQPQLLDTLLRPAGP